LPYLGGELGEETSDRAFFFTSDATGGDTITAYKRSVGIIGLIDLSAAGTTQSSGFVITSDGVITSANADPYNINK